MPIHRLLFLFLSLLLVACSPDFPEDVQLAYDALPERVDFNQHIRPILSDRCWSCHGPDEASRQAELRLDTEDGISAALTSGNGRAFKPGSVSSSQAIIRMLSDAPELVMPPPESKMSVTSKEIALIAKWVEQGAEWKDHWAFLPIEDPEIPDNPEGFAANGPIDQFLNTALVQQNLAPAGRAQNERLLRRLYLDLTGLPPSPEDMDTWLVDPSDEQYAATVDRLLATDAHAERLAVEWLDLARYADSHGLHADGYRTSWPYRDWVLDALKNNMPFDQFVYEQVAGDLIPEATQDQRLASAFNRMHAMTAEGGVIDEEMRLSYVFDRVNTVATGMLGLTMDCSRCHDHKFDPISQVEYYGFSAFFNNFNELGMVGDDGDFGPNLLLPADSTRRALNQLEQRLSALESARVEVTVSEEDLRKFLASDRVTAPKPDAYLPLDKTAKEDNGMGVDDFGWAPDGFKIVDDPERGSVAEFDFPRDEVYLDQGYGQYGTTEPFSAGIYVKTTRRDSLLTQTILGTSGQKNQQWRGQDLYLDEENRLNFRLIHILPNDALHVRTIDSLRTNRWYHVGFTYDGSGRAGGVKIYVDGLLPEQHILLDNLMGEAHPSGVDPMFEKPGQKLLLGLSHRQFTGEAGIFQGWLDDLKLWDRSLSALEMQRLANPSAQLEPDAARHHLLVTNPDYQSAQEKLRETKADQIAIQDTLVRVMVSQEMDQVRRTYRLNRGAYDAPGEEVFATTPAAVLPFPENFPKNRQGLVDWMFLEDNPLTARVAVNRYWQLVFGKGLVATPHDFGSQGALPSHPELLDHLATSFRKSGWDVRALIRRMVLSEAYRRDSDATPDQREVDPDNVYLARGPSGRMPAEMIRDNALAAAGLLNDRVGGPSVRPYQPEGLWIQANNFSQALLRYVPDHGDKLYRRSLYTFNKRTAPPPFMTNFDASGRDVCIVQRSQTNTPLQALNLLNDPQFVESARVLAQRVLAEKNAPEEQLAHAFRLVAGRKARPEETEVLSSLYAVELQRFTAEPALADSLLSVGEYPLPEALDPVRTAAMTSVGNVLFSFDEAYVKR